MKSIKKYKAFIKNYLLNKKSYQFLVKDWIELKDMKLASQLLATTRFSRNVAPILHPPIPNKKILVIAPHPDDEIFGAGGTLIQAIQAGSEVKTLYLTRGNAKSAAVAESEAQTVADKLGYKIEFMNYHAGQLPVDDDCVKQFSDIVNAYSPDILFIPFCLDDHDDHRRASHILLLANKKHPFASEIEIWAYQVYTSVIPSVVVDITSVASQKESAIRLWKSQMEKRDWVQFSLGLNAHNVRYLPYNKPGGYAETFFVLPLTAYLELCSNYFLSDNNASYYNPAYF